MLARTLSTSDPFVDFTREMDRLFETIRPMAAGTNGATPARPFPLVNMWQEAETLHAEAELPGMSGDDVEVFVEPHELVIKGHRRVGHAEGTRLLLAERADREFSRRIGLPVEVDADQAEASLRDGVLRVTMPLAASARPRRISVSGAESS